MCLRNVNFATKYDKHEGCTVGIGYKAVNITNNSGKIIRNHRWYPFQKWSEAKQTWGGKSLDNTLINSDDGELYTPGFHVFLNEKDAESYCGDSDIVMVKFHDVLAFGTNITYGPYRPAPCVIARWIKVVKILKKFKDRYVVD